MSLDSILGLIQTALELGLISSLTVLALFLSYSMLGVCDLSTDGCFTLGATVGAAIAIAGHPYLSIPAAMLAGMLSGLVTAVLQTKMGVNSLLSGIRLESALQLSYSTWNVTPFSAPMSASCDWMFSTIWFKDASST